MTNDPWISPYSIKVMNDFLDEKYYSFLNNIITNTQESRAHIQDADFTAETSALTRAQILNQAATSMLAQANASKQSVLALLQQ